MGSLDRRTLAEQQKHEHLQRLILYSASKYANKLIDPVCILYFYHSLI